MVASTDAAKNREVGIGRLLRLPTPELRKASGVDEEVLRRIADAIKGRAFAARSLTGPQAGALRYLAAESHLRWIRLRVPPGDDSRAARTLEAMRSGDGRRLAAVQRTFQKLSRMGLVSWDFKDHSWDLTDEGWQAIAGLDDIDDPA